MKSVLVLIVLLLAGIAGLLYIKFSQETVTWAMDPARMIVPVDQMAELSMAGDLNSAYFKLGFRANEIERGYDEADVDPDGLTDIWVDFDPAAVTLLINSLTLYFSYCFIDQDPSDVAYDRIACDDEGDGEDPSAFSVGARHLAKAMWLEAEGWNSNAVATLYKNAGSKIGGLLAGGISTYNDEDRRKVAALVRDFTFARVARLQLLDGDLDAPFIDGSSSNRWCSDEFDEVCPGGLSTYIAIKLYLNGNRRDARTAALVALEGSQPWVYRSPYEHPLLWILAASRHMGIDDDTSDLQPLIDDALIAWPEDARTALLAYVDPDALHDSGALPDGCDTPGCRFFLAQRHIAHGDTAAGEAAHEAGLDLCRAIRSIPCTALRHAGAEAVSP